MAKSQHEMVLEYLKTHSGITSLEAYQKFGIMQMPKRIFNLRKLGYEISTRREQGVNRFGKAVSFAVYSLVKQAVCMTTDGMANCAISDEEQNGC